MKDDKQTEFLIQIKNQENYSWQGTIHWLQENRKENFRSAIEMIRLIDSVLLEKADETGYIGNEKEEKEEE